MVFLLVHVKVYIGIFLDLISLFFSVSLSFFQKDLPLPRKSSRWVFFSFIPPSLHLFPALWGETGSLREENTERCCRAWFACCALKALRMLEWCLWRVVFMWMRRRSAAGMLGVCRSLIKASRELWMLSMVLKATAPFAVAQLLALYLPSSLPIARWWIPFLFHSHFHPFALPSFLNPFSFSSFRLPLSTLVSFNTHRQQKYRK